MAVGDTDLTWLYLLIGGLVLLVLIIILLKSCIKVVKEKETMVIEHLGRFKEVLTPGIHVIVPFIDRPRDYSWSYMVSNTRGQLERRLRSGDRISTQNEVLDLNKQIVISRDNAQLYLDAILCYKIISPRTMIYTSQNLPNMLEKVLQAQLRNVAGSLDVDQLIEDTTAMNGLTGLMDQEAARWGVKVNWIRCQKIEAPSLADDLAKKKNADLQNKEIIIRAKQVKQTSIIESEGRRDSMIKEAEGQGQEMLAKARGQAQAIINAANAEARTIREVGRAIMKVTRENPVKYLLSVKYLEAMRAIVAAKGTTVELLPHQSATLQVIQALGLNTVVPGPAPPSAPDAAQLRHR